MANDGCQSPIPPSSGRMGLYIEGSVSPPLSGVHIKIIASEDSKITPLKKDEIAFQTATGVDGSFLGGPLYDDITYRVEASKVLFSYITQQVNLSTRFLCFFPVRRGFFFCFYISTYISYFMLCDISFYSCSLAIILNV